MRINRRILLRAVALAAFVMALAVVLYPSGRAAATEGDQIEIYVSAAHGDDNDGLGTQESPYASIARAFECIDRMDGHPTATVYVMDNLTATSSARYWDADVTLTSLNGKQTISRGDIFAGAQDDQRGGYNGPIIEVGNTGSLTITNLILDDAGKHEGTHYVQVANNQGNTDIGGQQISNKEIVQDSIITTFSQDFTITLGEGCELRNFGGMSAVRVCNGKFIMKSGSSINDTNTAINREKQQNDYGYAGAVWVQSGTFILEQGASIRNTSGHAVYADGFNSDVTINGQIASMKADTNAWQGGAGGALHLRGGASAKVSGTITGVNQYKSDNSIVYVTGGGTLQSSFTLDETAKIDGEGNNLIGVQLYGNNGVYSYVNGEITGMGNSAVHVNTDGKGTNDPESMKLVIGPDALIHGNSGGYGTVTIQSQAAKIDVYGKIVDNVSSDHCGLCMANNFGTKTVTLHAGAEISRNYSRGGISGVRVSLGTLVMEEGALVEDNISASKGDGAGIWVTNSGQLIMEGGAIKNNTAAGIGAGVTLEATLIGSGPDPYAQLISGSVVGGTTKAEVTEANGEHSVAGGVANCISIAGGSSYGTMARYLSVSDDVELSEQSIFMDDYDLHLENLGDNVKLGNASEMAESAAKTAYTTDGLTEVRGSFWYATDGAAREFSITDLYYDSTKPLYAAVMKTDARGTAESSAIKLRSVKANSNGTLSLTLPGQSENGYAVVFLQQAPDKNVVSIIPTNVTVYEGGDGYTAVVDGSGNVASNSMPHPLFIIEGIDEDAGELTFTNTTNNKSWTAVSDGNGYYHFKPDDGQDNVRVTYTDATGEKATNDIFDVSDVEDTFKQFEIDFYLGHNALNDIQISGKPDYRLVLGTGTLTVRAIQADDPSAVVTGVEREVPSEPLTSGKAVAVESESGTFYTLNDTGVKLPMDDSEPSLLFDDIIDEDVNRTDALVDRVKQEFGAIDENCCQAKYLDLVDANNSNAWVKASQNVTVYWGYPEGTDKNTKFTLYHFEGLHRDGENSGFDLDDISAATVDEVNIETTDEGISFSVEPGGFSPFVLVWEKDSGGSVTPPATTYTITASAGEGGSISPSGKVSVPAGSSKTFTFTPDEGNKVHDVVIDGRSIGACGSYTFDNVHENHTISVTFTRGNAPADPGDTGVDEWFDVVNHNEYLHGYDNGTNNFGPDDKMTRAQAAAMFYNMMKDKSHGTVEVGFQDVPEDAWYAEAIFTLASHGLVVGTSPTTFEPDRPITRAEFTAIAMRFSNGDVSGENIFTDVFEGDWYYEAIVGSIKYGWISGYVDGTGRFGPNDCLTRGQATAIANRMLGRVPDGVFISEHLDDLKLFSDVNQEHYAFRDIVEATNPHEYTKDGGFEHWNGLK